MKKSIMLIMNGVIPFHSIDNLIASDQMYHSYHFEMYRL